MRLSIPFALLLFFVSACRPIETAVVVELSPAASPRVIYVTPTRQPSPIPTIDLATPTLTVSPTLRPSNTPNVMAQQAQCSTVLTNLYTQASNVCLGEASGYVCNGGLAPRAEPEGRISNALALTGSLLESNILDSLHSKALLSENSGGILWMRLSDSTKMSALMIGDVQMRDVTPENAGFAPWLSFVVQTHDSITQAACATAPHSSLIVQGPYGENSRMVINGASLDLSGTIVIQTTGTETIFSAIEGRSRLTVFGTSQTFYAGEALTVPYPEGDFSRPLAAPSVAALLDYSRIQNLPIVLLDRPVLLPQAGLVRTIGRTNMRAEASEESRLLFQVPSDEPVSILGKNSAGDWYHMRLGNGETGWMRADLVEGQVGDINTVYDSTPIPPQRYGTSANRAIITAQHGGNLRRAPDVAFNVLTTIPAGTEVELLARSPYSPWVKVSVGTQTGWMALITMETNTVINFLPIEYDVPLPPGPTATPIFTFGGGHAYPDPTFGQ